MTPRTVTLAGCTLIAASAITAQWAGRTEHGPPAAWNRLAGILLVTGFGLIAYGTWGAVT